MEALKIVSLSGGYNGHNVLKDISFSLKNGTFCSLCGPNGSGKSTLLKYIIKALKPNEKEIFIYGRDSVTLNQRDIARFVSFVSQNPVFEYDFTVRELVRMGRFCHSDIASSTDIVDRALEKCGISSLSEKLLTCISGGEIQLSMIARAVCQDSPVILLDEPLNNLDIKYQIKILSFLKEYAESGRTVICVMHDINLARNWSEKCILINNGELCSFGNSCDVLSNKNISDVYNID